MTIGANELLAKYKNDTIAIADAWLRGQILPHEERYVRELVDTVHVHAARVRAESDAFRTQPKAIVDVVTRGFYKHYKGGVYFVIGVSRNDDTGEELVIYESVQGSNDEPHRLRHRTVKEFTEEVDAPSPSEAGTYKTPRFKRVEKW